MKAIFFSMILFTSLFLITGQATAQLKKFSIGPYLEGAWPKGDFLQTNGNGIGAGIAGDIKLGTKLNLMGSAGYLRFGRRTGEAASEVISAVPIRAGLKYKLPLVYVKMETGTVAINRQKGSAWILSPGLGIRVLGLDLQGSYETWLADQARSFASLKIAYHF